MPPARVVRKKRSGEFMFLDVRSSIVCSREDALATALHVESSPALRSCIDRVAVIPIKYSKAGIILHGFIVMILELKLPSNARHVNHTIKEFISAGAKIDGPSIVHLKAELQTRVEFPD